MNAVTAERATPRRRLASAAPRVRAAAGAPWLPFAVLGLIMVIAAIVLMWAGRDTTFFYDDWPYVQDRLGWQPDVFLEPHNEHLQAVSVLIYKVLFTTVGIEEYWPYRAVLVVLNLLTGLLLFLYARRRVGDWPAVGLAACLIFTSLSWYNLIYAFQVNFVGATAAGLGAMLAFDRRTRRGDVVGTALLCVCLASSSVGFPFLIGAAIEWALRDDRRRRWWVMAVPVGLYALWSLTYGQGNSIRLHNVPDIPNFVIDGYDDSVAAISGVGMQFAPMVAFVLAALVIRDFVVPGRAGLRLISTVLMALSYWALTALGRADMGIEADANRYLYASGILVALVALEVARRYPIGPRAATAATLLLLFGAVNLGNGVNGGGDVLRQWSSGGRPSATAYEIAGHLNPNGVGDPTQPFFVARPYLEATRHYKSRLGYPLDELRGLDAGRQMGVDQALTRVHGAGVGPAPADGEAGAVPPRVVAAKEGVPDVNDGCVAFPTIVPGGQLDVVLPADGLVVRAGEVPVEVRLRRFSPQFPDEKLGEVVGRTSGGLRIARDLAPEPWVVRLSSSRPFEACAA